MRRLTVGCVLAVPIAALILYACSPFESSSGQRTADAAAGTVFIDSGPILGVEAGFPNTDGGVTTNPADYTETLADGGTIHRLDLTQGSGDFAPSGNAALTDAGFAMQLANTSQNSITRVFVNGQSFTATTVRIDERVQVAGAFQGSQYSDGIAQFFGPSPGDGLVPRMSFEYQTDETGLNVWPGAGTGNKEFFNLDDDLLALGALDGPIWIDTTWAVGGEIDVYASGAVVHNPAATSSEGVTSSSLSLIIGGGSSTSLNPVVSILVRSVCVGFR